MAVRRTAFAQRRRARGLTQETLAAAIGASPSTVQGWEAGRHPPQPFLRPRLATALNVTEDELDALINADTVDTSRECQDGSTAASDPFSAVQILTTRLTARHYQTSESPAASPEGEGPAASPEGEGPAATLTLPDGTSVPIVANSAPHELDALLLAPLEQWATLDNRLGPAPLRPLAAQHFTLIESYLDQARGADFSRIAYATARHAEFCGWLAQDSGDLPAAMRWTEAALEAARLIADRELEAYVLMRQSNIASDQGRADLAVALADAAWHAGQRMPGPLQALALRQRAHALAVNRNAPAALRAIDNARQQLTITGTSPSTLTAYCTQSYLDMEAAACLVNLGQPTEAIPVLEAGLGAWSPQFQRDLGLCLARLALAYAHTREPDSATPIAAHAARIARSTRSHRTTRVIRQVAGQLNDTDAQQIEGALAHTPTDL